MPQRLWSGMASNEGNYSSVDLKLGGSGKQLEAHDALLVQLGLAAAAPACALPKGVAHFVYTNFLSGPGHHASDDAPLPVKAKADRAAGEQSLAASSFSEASSSRRHVGHRNRKLAVSGGTRGSFAGDDEDPLAPAGTGSRRRRQRRKHGHGAEASAFPGKGKKKKGGESSVSESDMEGSTTKPTSETGGTGGGSTPAVPVGDVHHDQRFSRSYTYTNIDGKMDVQETETRCKDGNCQTIARHMVPDAPEKGDKETKLVLVEPPGVETRKQVVMMTPPGYAVPGGTAQVATENLSMPGQRVMYVTNSASG
mmetsp:Transcript_44696/g.106061  ORF Transcript_44696/g.106061 Transcript_44696/m.106061 type:complete len:310 (+) Transcript_44696:118-1047(+)